MLDKAKTQLDPITVEVIGSALTTIVEEMGKAIIRAAYSTNIKERQDCSTALFDAEGRTIAQAEALDAMTVRFDLTGAGDRELPLTLALMPVLFRAHVDPDLFPLVLRDLWVASGHAPAPRRRTLHVESDGDFQEVRLVRHADPIEPRVLQALFDPFDLNDDATGVTIGLYLARALTVAHGGTLGLEQDDEQAALWVRLPRRHP